MKKIIFILLILCVPLFVYTQRHTTGRAIVFEKDIFGNLKYNDRGGFEATLARDIFDDITYEDNKKNKLTYNKKFLDRLHPDGEHSVFNDLIGYFRDKEGVQENFEIDIFDKLIYKDNKGFRAGFSRNIFGDVEYEDSNGNKIIYRQKFLDLFDLYDLKELDVYVFMDMLYSLMREKNYKEEYEVDIFGNVKFTSSGGVSVKIDKGEVRNKRNKRGRNGSVWRNFF